MVLSIETIQISWIKYQQKKLQDRNNFKCSTSNGSCRLAKNHLERQESLSGFKDQAVSSLSGMEDYSQRLTRCHAAALHGRN